jgi:predicted MFS family arabinose efflux permease
MGALSSIMDIGQSAGPLITGIIITLAGYTYGFFAGLILVLLVTGIFVLSAWSEKGAGDARDNMES